MRDHIALGAVAYCCIDWRHVMEISSASDVGWNLLNFAVQDQSRTRFFLPQSARIGFCFRNGKEPHRNNVQLGRHGRSQIEWTYPGANGFARKGAEPSRTAPPR